MTSRILLRHVHSLVTRTLDEIGRLLDALSWLVTVRPRVTLAVLALVTSFLAAGVTMRAPQAGSSVVISDESDLAVVLANIQQRFGDSGQQISAPLLFRGDVLTPEGLDQIARAIERVTADPKVSQALAETDAVVAPTQLFAQILGHDDFASTSEAEIDGAVDQIRSHAGPTTRADVARSADWHRLRRHIGRGRHGSSAWRRRRGAASPAERQIDQLVRDTEGPLSARSLSPALIDEEAAAATGSTMVRLMGLALVVVVTVLLDIAATGIESTFDRRDLLPTGGEARTNLATLDHAFGGSTENVSVLIEAEVTQSRTILNLLDFTDAFNDDLRRPRGVDGDIQASLGLLAPDWITDNGTPED